MPNSPIRQEYPVFPAPVRAFVYWPLRVSAGLTPHISQQISRSVRTAQSTPVSYPRRSLRASSNAVPRGVGAFLRSDTAKEPCRLPAEDESGVRLPWRDR